MPISIPESVFDKYFDVIDSTFTIFGITCQLVSIEKKEVIIYSPDNNHPDVNTINDHRRGGGTHNRGTKTIKEVEVLTDITIKVYWDSKQWIKVGGSDIAIPDNAIQTIFYMYALHFNLPSKTRYIRPTRHIWTHPFAEVPAVCRPERRSGCVGPALVVEVDP